MNTEILYIVITLIGLAIPMVAAKYGYNALNAAAVFLVLLTTITASHLISLFGYVASAGVMVFAAIFLTTDIISELHGKKKAMQTVVITVIANVLLAGLGYLIAQIPGFTPNPISDALKTLFTFVPRLLLGGLIAFAVSQTIDVRLFHWYKKKTSGKHLWLRNTGSTLISQAVDSFLVVMIAFYGVIPNLGELFLTTYIIKVLIALLDTPFCYLARYLHRKQLA